MVGFQLNTKVLMADNTYKNIQDIQINDSVMSWDETNQCLVPQTVVNTFSETCNELTIYTFDNGDVLYGCQDLIFLTTDGWKENIEIGDLVITKSGLPTALVDEEVLGSETVYELDIEDIDNYIVENIIVHNAIASCNWKLTFDVLLSPYAGTAYLWKSTTSATSGFTYTGASGSYGSPFAQQTLMASNNVPTHVYFQFSTSSSTLDPLIISGYSANVPSNISSYWSGTRVNNNLTIDCYGNFVGSGLINGTGTSNVELTQIVTYSASINADYFIMSSLGQTGYVWTSTSLNGTKTYLGVLSTSTNLTYTSQTQDTVYFWLSTSSSSYTEPAPYFITDKGTGNIGTITDNKKGISIQTTTSNPVVTPVIEFLTTVKLSASITDTLYVWAAVNQGGPAYKGVLSTTALNINFRNSTGSITIYLSTSSSSNIAQTAYTISSISGGTKTSDSQISSSTNSNVILTLDEAVTNPPIYIGTDQISKVYVGTNEVVSIYIGTNKIY